MTENDKNEMLRVILCKPDEAAETVEIEDNLESMQGLVGGLIQEYMPFHSETDRVQHSVNQKTIPARKQGSLFTTL